MNDDKGEVRWHPYLMLSLGSLFLILGVVNWYINRGVAWNYDTTTSRHYGAPAAAAPISVLAGILLLGLGSYGLTRPRI
jgi:hypothetical protein